MPLRSHVDWGYLAKAANDAGPRDYVQKDMGKDGRFVPMLGRLASRYRGGKASPRARHDFHAFPIAHHDSIRHSGGAHR